MRFTAVPTYTCVFHPVFACILFCSQVTYSIASICCSRYICGIKSTPAPVSCSSSWRLLTTCCFQSFSIDRISITNCFCKELLSSSAIFWNISAFFSNSKLTYCHSSDSGIYWFTISRSVSIYLPNKIWERWMSSSWFSTSSILSSRFFSFSFFTLSSMPINSSFWIGFSR